jgi:hypothetical protein
MVGYSSTEALEYGNNTQSIKYIYYRSETEHYGLFSVTRSVSQCGALGTNIDFKVPPPPGPPLLDL